MCYIRVGAVDEASPGLAGRSTAGSGTAEDFAMTIEIIYLTARIHHWLNVRVARHLAAQAARLAR
jgi:hypothetical protein